MADTEPAPVVSFKKRATKTTARKRPATPPPASDSDSDFTSSEDEEGRQIKRRRKNAGVVVSSASDQQRRQDDNTLTTTGEITVAARQSNADNATKRSDWYDDEHDKKHVRKPDTAPSASDGTYKGAANYQSFIQKNPDRQTNVGPQKLNSNVRSITVTDFAPDVCKDYKQTGFCGFGDSCKFLHAREDYKQGWQLDRDWEISTKDKKLTGRVIASANRGKNEDIDEDDEKLLESIPFACIICKKSYSNPVVTKCNHYFCEQCALKRYRKDPSCAACGAGTGGVFNTAKRLNRLLDKKRERQKQKREKAIENGEKIPEEESEPAPA